MTEDTYELRCHAKLHGIVVSPGVLEIACRSDRCGWRPGKVVLHRFEVETGKLLGTREYKTIDMQVREA
jgi:hypothetical protein